MASAETEALPIGDVVDSPKRILTQRFAGPAWCLLLIVVALVIGMWNVSESGPKWPDGPRYANGAAMIHDWILSGELLHPYEFAKKNYTQYPGFSIPYHPPGYPGLMALWFLGVGMSYASARCFVALCPDHCRQANHGQRKRNPADHRRQCRQVGQRDIQC